MEPPIETEEKALFFLIDWSEKVSRNMFPKYKRFDPFFSKILDSVNYQIEKQNYKKKQFLARHIIVEVMRHQKNWFLPDSQFIHEFPSDLFQEIINDSKSISII